MENQKVKIIRTVGYSQMVLGIIAGIYLGKVFPWIEMGYFSARESFNILLMLLVSGVSIITGIFILGFAELIQLTHNQLTYVRETRDAMQRLELTLIESNQSN